jgi:hypothetical protein
VLCIELMEGIRLDEPRYTVVLSLPDTENTLAYSYGRAGRPLTSSEWDDMRSRVADLFHFHVIARGGAQEVMPL